MNLDNLAIKYNTDKSSLIHNYAVKYDEIFKGYTDKFDKILEIGVLFGSSLKMWGDYFKNATIIGFDENDKSFLNTDKIKTIIGNQNNKQDLLKLEKFAPFDLVVDDGSHQYKHQILTFESLFGLIKPNGFYIVEDICTSYWDEYKKTSFTSMDYFKNLIDDVNFNGIRLGDLNDRKESLLTTLYKQKFNIEYIQFFNSIIIIRKK